MFRLLRTPIDELRWIVRVSRPRFWMYLFGPFLIGIVGAVRSLTTPQKSFILHLQYIRADLANLFEVIFISFPHFVVRDPLAALMLILIAILIFGYFLFPANLLIYGVNDLFDIETDLLNPKKRSYESTLSIAKRQRLLLWIVVSQLPWVGWLIAISFVTTEKTIYPFLPFLVFFFLGIFYSAPPIRAKARPFLDSLFNCLYVMPGLLSYFFMLSETAPITGFGPTPFPWLPFLAGCLWCMAMHAYSAVPDIKADMGANLQTIATKLGARTTLYVCLGLYVIATILACIATQDWSLRLLIASLGLVYVIMMSLSLMEEDVLPIYKRFPLVNTLVGSFLFFGLWLF